MGKMLIAPVASKGVTVKRIFIFIIFSLIGFSTNLLCQQNQETIYPCVKTQEKITIDGKLNEQAWKNAKEIKFKEIVKGSEPEYSTVAKILWDSEFLYIGMEIEDHDIWARASLKDNECPKEYVERVNIHRYMKNPEWHRLECDIMTFDNFIKIFLDPDADGKNYMEFHINAVNNIFDAWYEEGLKPGQQELESPHVSWTCPKLISATFIKGTINAPHDIDEGWSFEMAIPWAGIKQFVKGNCPPKSGDIWAMLLGRTYRDYSWSPERFYWTWPVVGECTTHNPSLYGKLIFIEKEKSTPVLFASGGGNPEEIVPQSKEIGVKGFLCSAYPLSQLRKFVDAGKKYNVEIYPTLSLADMNLWKEKYSGIEVPLQKMSQEEVKAYEFLKDRNNRFSTNYQWGEEPKGRKTEVLIQDIMCFHDERVKNLFKEKIKEILKVDGITGIGFDFIGYQNYHCCYCDVSEKLFQQYCKENKDIQLDKARDKFSLETLVNFYNDLADYARSIKPDIKIITHIYPVFLPEIFYGNQLNIDYPAQTVAWFLPWNTARVKRFTKLIVENEKKYFQRVNATAMIGYYYHRDNFPEKSAEQVENELKTIIENGCNYILVHSINDVLKNSEVKKIFSKYFKETQ